MLQQEHWELWFT